MRAGVVRRARCDRRCDCYRHVAVKNALELRDEAEDVELETVVSQSGYAIRPHGTRRRDGTCACYEDEDGTKWTGRGVSRRRARAQRRLRGG